MKNLELEGFGLVEMNNKEMLELEGGGGLWSFVYDYTLGKIIDFTVDHMIEDYKSRSGGPASLTDRYANHGPY